MLLLHISRIGSSLALKNGMRPRALVGAFVVAVAIAGVLYVARYMLLLGFFAILVAVVMSFPVNLITQKTPAGRGLAVVVTLVLMLGGFSLVGLSMAPVVSRQLDQLSDQVPKAAAQLDRLLATQGPAAVSKTPQGRQIAVNVRDRLAKGVGEVASRILPAAVSAVSVAGTAVFLLVLAAFLVHSPDEYFRSIRSLFSVTQQGKVDELWRRLRHSLRGWIGGIIISMALMGTVTGVGLWAAGIQGWFTLGVLTFFGTFVPYAGAIASAIPGLIIGLAQDTTHFFYALAVYTCVHIIEGYIVEPYVMKRAVDLKPAMLLFWQAIMGAVFGIIGILVATPLLVCVRTIVRYLYVEERLGRVSPDSAESAKRAA